MENTARDTYAVEMRDKVRSLRAQLDELADNLKSDANDAKKDTRLKYHEIKDELNEIDKMIDKMKEIADNSWENIKDDISEMWAKITKEMTDA
jgi:Mg2+ and Co2+ transporter CorA